MSLSQIDRFIEQIKMKNKIIERVWLIGGEPTLHPQFSEIHKILLKSNKDGYIKKLGICYLQRE
jgi:MoaA/NifB/PqqE/SkfB family radical SAM enzyme